MNLLEWCNENNNRKLLNEWHYERNYPLRPEDVTCASNKRVWWIDELGHEWQAVISHRTGRGDDCPFCRNKKVFLGYNDLLTLRPDIAADWNYERNGDLRPENVTPGSNMKVWWKCSNPECGDEWPAQVNSRCTRGHGCPVCDGKKVKAGYNDFATAFPSIAAEWHPAKNGELTTADVTKSSNKRVWWKCSNPLCGHEWSTTVYHRSKGQGCPRCNKRTSFPEQAIYYYLRQMPGVTVKNREKVYGYEIDVFIEDWRMGIEYDGALYHNSTASEIRDGRKDQCLKENGIILIRIKESNQSITINNDEEKVIYCVIDATHKYIEDVFVRLIDLLASLGHVNICLDIDIDRDRQAITALCNRPNIENSLAYFYPELAKAFHPSRNENLKSTDISYGSSRKIWWLCPNCGHEWSASPHNRTKGKGCPKCWENRRRKCPDNKETK